MEPEALALWLFAGLAVIAPLAVLEWLVRACLPRLRHQALRSLLVSVASGTIAVLLFALLNRSFGWHAAPMQVALAAAFCSGVSLHWLGNALLRLLAKRPVAVAGA